MATDRDSARQRASESGVAESDFKYSMTDAGSGAFIPNQPSAGMACTISSLTHNSGVSETIKTNLKGSNMDTMSGFDNSIVESPQICQNIIETGDKNVSQVEVSQNQIPSGKSNQNVRGSSGKKKIDPYDDSLVKTFDSSEFDQNQSVQLPGDIFSSDQVGMPQVQ